MRLKFTLLACALVFASSSAFSQTTYWHYKNKFQNQISSFTEVNQEVEFGGIHLQFDFRHYLSEWVFLNIGLGIGQGSQTWPKNNLLGHFNYFEYSLNAGIGVEKRFYKQLYGSLDLGLAHKYSSRYIEDRFDVIQPFSYNTTSIYGRPQISWQLFETFAANVFFQTRMHLFHHNITANDRFLFDEKFIGKIFYAGGIGATFRF